MIASGMVLLAISLILTFPASSAADVQIPGSIRPGQIEKQLKEFPIPKAEPPAIQIIPEKPIPQAEEGAVSLVLKGVRFSGATVYPEPVLQEFFAELLGKTVTLGQIRAAAENLTAHYRNEGYILAQALIPPQTVAAGIVRIDLVEGAIGEVVFQGDDPHDDIGLIREYAEKIRAEKPVRMAVIERYLLLMNDLPGIVAHGSLAPSKKPGAADLIIEITRKEFGAIAGFNNRLTKLLGTYRGEVYGEANSIAGLQERTSARVLQSFEGKMTVLSLTEDVPVFSEGTRLSVMLNQVWSSSSIFQIQDQLDSYLLSLNLQAYHPLIRGRNSNLYLRGAFSLIDSKSTADSFHETIVNDRLRAFRAGLTYDLADRWQGINIVDLELSQGINALGARNPSQQARQNGTAKLSAANGQVDYTKVTLYAARLQSLWRSLSLLLAFNGQYSEDVLLAPEQFAIGGEEFLRAYDPSEFIGDKGFATKAELRYTIDPAEFASTTFYSFFDYGQVHYNDHRSPDISAEAAGLGVRLSVTRYFTGYVEAAKPMHPNQTTERNKDWRVFGGFRLTY